MRLRRNFVSLPSSLRSEVALIVLCHKARENADVHSPNGASRAYQLNTASFLSATGIKITKPNADFVREATGFAIGGIPPIGHKHPILTLIDEDLLQYDELWAAAGTPNAVFRLLSKNLIDLTEGIIINIK